MGIATVRFVNLRFIQSRHFHIMLDLFYVGTVQQIYGVLLHSVLQVYRVKFIDSKSAVRVFVKFDVCFFLVVYYSVCYYVLGLFTGRREQISIRETLCVLCILFSYHSDECILNTLTCWYIFGTRVHKHMYSARDPVLKEDNRDCS